MRAIIQRVTRASVTVDGATVGDIARGLVVLVGVSPRDTPEDGAWIVAKLLAARLFPSPSGRQWGSSVVSLGLPLLVVSQFTLHGTLKKPQPDFHRSAPAAVARELFDGVVAALRAQHGAERVATGAFGEMMALELVNDGPVTLSLDSKNRAFVEWDEPGADDAGAGKADVEA
jgi:D-tyrosyl-tRNA(Tyr) deacylase